MDRRQKVELFEQIRRGYEFGVGIIAGVARQLGGHRRLVRQALQSAWPPERRRSVRSCPRLTPVQLFIDAMLEQDRQAPRQQAYRASDLHAPVRRAAAVADFRTPGPAVRAGAESGAGVARSRSLYPAEPRLGS